ncbi:MAG: hypothetical protein KJS97_14820 [Alphaproteobacteria bacterium]|nr:hypothetical protein [Alphaproteobacteria bacterium]
MTTVVHPTAPAIEAVRIPWQSWALLTIYATGMIALPPVIRDSDLSQTFKAMSVVVSLGVMSSLFLVLWELVLTATRADRIR